MSAVEKEFERGGVQPPPVFDRFRRLFSRENPAQTGQIVLGRRKLPSGRVIRIVGHPNDLHPTEEEGPQ